MKNVIICIAFLSMFAAAACAEKAKPQQESSSLDPEYEGPELDEQRKELVGPKIPIMMCDRERKLMNINLFQVKIFFGSKEQVESDLNQWFAKHARVLLTPAIQFYALDKDMVYVTVTYSMHQRYCQKQSDADIVDIPKK